MKTEFKNIFGLNTDDALYLIDNSNILTKKLFFAIETVFRTAFRYNKK